MQAEEITNMGGQAKIDVSGLRRVRERMFTAFTDKQTAKLLEYAPLQLANAYNGRGFKNDTWNLADSYVWVVYYKGVVQGSGYLWNNRVAQKDSDFHKTKVNGRKLAETFISQYNADTINGWEVVWAATAPYSTYLENGTMYGQFNVLSSIYDEVTNDFSGKGIVDIKIKYKK